jgi:hypothetical protein
MLAEAQAAGDIDWMVSVDSTIKRAHRQATDASRVKEPRGTRTLLREHDITAVIPQPSDRVGYGTRRGPADGLRPDRREGRNVVARRTVLTA